MKSLLRSGSARPAALAAVLLAGLGTSAHAQLILHLDTAAKDLWFTGTDTGTGGDFNGLYYTAQWAAGAAGLVKFFDVKLDSSLISISGNSY
ncbi:MAG TPA: hypothetical protein PKE47_11985, partial [Verrucomicrobiota bacterium]|nr:hypothetical protein [Verrucomicrobiota bacterium]